MGAFLYAFTGWLVGTLDGVSLCVFESPILPRQTSLATCRKLYGLAGITQMTCHRRHIECMEVAAPTVKAFMGLTRQVSGGPDVKQQMIRAVGMFGYDVESHDEADAIAIRLFVLHKCYPQHRAVFSTDLGLLGAVADNG